MADHCHEGIRLRFVISHLPRPEALADNLKAMAASLMATDTQLMAPAQLHGLLDDTQAGLGLVHDQAAANWFLTVH